MWCLLSCKWDGLGCMKVGWASSWWWDAKWSSKSFFNALFFLLFSCVVCKVHVCSSPSSWLAHFACCMPAYPHHRNTIVIYIFYALSVLAWQLFFFHCDICSYEDYSQSFDSWLIGRYLSCLNVTISWCWNNFQLLSLLAIQKWKLNGPFLLKA